MGISPPARRFGAGGSGRPGLGQWIETPTKFLNLARVSLLSVVPSDQEPGRWVVLAQVGTVKHFVSVHDSPVEARNHLADLLEADD